MNGLPCIKKTLICSVDAGEGTMAAAVSAESVTLNLSGVEIRESECKHFNSARSSPSSHLICQFSSTLKAMSVILLFSFGGEEQHFYGLGANHRRSMCKA